MRALKLLGVVVGILLLIVLIPVGLGMIARSPIAMLGLLVLGFLVVAAVRFRRVDGAAGSWFIRRHDRSANQARDDILQHSEALRRRNNQAQQRPQRDSD